MYVPPDKGEKGSMQLGTFLFSFVEAVFLRILPGF
jgi:hypothetical protein